MDFSSFPALLAVLGISIPIWDQYVHLLVLALDGLTSIFHSAGLAIIAFTIIVKTIMLPLTVKSIRSIEGDAGSAAEDQGASEEARQ